MSSRVTSEAATVKADVEAVFGSLARAVESFEEKFESDGTRAVWREELAWQAARMIEKVRGCISGLIVGLLLKLNEVLCRPFLVRPYEAQAAALIARNAAIEGDSDTVDAFSRKVLGKKHPARWREAVEMALLGDWVVLLGTGTATKPYVRDLLQRHADVQHRYLQPVWEGRINGERTVLLAHPVDEMRTIADLLVEYRTPEQDLLSKERDIRVSAVLKHLSAEEQALALAWAEYGAPWPEVANELGQKRQFGEKVRRKLSRLGDRHTDRAAEAERTTRRMR
ncbi:hypothetical protein ACWD4T_02660 [Streptomyces umbrinus]